MEICEFWYLIENVSLEDNNLECMICLSNIRNTFRNIHLVYKSKFFIKYVEGIYIMIK